MKRLLIALCILTFLGSIAWASDYESFTVMHTAVALSKSDIGYRDAFITIEGEEVRIRKDGGALASATEGHLLYDTDSIRLTNRKEIRHFSVIRALGQNSTADTVTVQVTYED